MSFLSFSTDLLARCSAGSSVLCSFLRAIIAVLCSFQFANLSCASSSLSISKCSSSSNDFVSFSESFFFLASHAFCVLCKLSIVFSILLFAVCIPSILAVSSVIASLVCFICSFKLSAFSESRVIPRSCSIIAR